MRRKWLKPVLFWIAAMVICPLGLTFCAKSGFGVSMIEAPVYVSYLYLHTVFSWFTFGTAEYVIQAILLAALCVVIRKFRWRYLLSFVTAFLFGEVLDFWNLILGVQTFPTMFGRVAGAVAGTLITTLAVALFFRTWMPQEVWELVVKEFADVKKKPVTRVKLFYDIGSLSLGIILMLIFFHEWRWDAVGAVAILGTLVNAPLIGFWGRVVDRVFHA